MWRFSCFGGRFFFLWLLRASKCSCYDCAQTRHSSSDRIFFLFDAGDGVRSPSESPTLPHAHAPHSLLLLIISFIITCRMTRVHLSYDLQQTANASYSAVSCCHCTVLRYIFISPVHMFLYPGYSGLQDSKSSFL